MCLYFNKLIIVQHSGRCGMCGMGGIRIGDSRFYVGAVDRISDLRFRIGYHIISEDIFLLSGFLSGVRSGVFNKLIWVACVKSLSGLRSRFGQHGGFDDSIPHIS